MTTITLTYAHAYQSICLVGNDFHGWAIHTDGGTRAAYGETLAGWSAVGRSPHGRMCIVRGPVITTEAHLAYAGARIHSTNTAELNIAEALFFARAPCLVPKIHTSDFFQTRCQHLHGHCPIMRERSPWARMSGFLLQTLTRIT